ncbi:MAG: hypothetical protein WB867_03705 [Candidatus Dormiibacterota bacterium]
MVGHSSIRYGLAGLLAGVAAVLALVLPMQSVEALGSTSLLTESFTNSTVTSSNWVVGGTDFAPCLTASTDTTQTPIPGCGTDKVGLPPGGDASGDGALRLTDNSTGEAGFILYNEPLPTQAGLVVNFDQYQYDGDGADGISFFLANGEDSLTAPGTPGGYLGYAGGDNGIGVGDGVVNGLFGVGLDAYGNYSNFSNPGCPTYTPAAHPNEVGVRGPGDDETGYCWLGGTGTLATPLLHEDADASRTDAGVLVAVQITMDPPSDTTPEIHVSLNGTNVLNVPEPADLPTTFKFGFSASTGAYTDIHEISGLQVATVNALAPSWDLSGTTSGTFTAGGTADFIFTATPDPAWGSGVDPVTLTDTLEDGAKVASLPSGTGWNCAATVIGSSTVSCSYTITGSQTPGVPLPSLTVPERLPTIGGTVVNSATVNSADNNPADTANSITVSRVLAAAAPTTGADLGGPGLVGLLAILFGGTLLLAGRRLRRVRAH